VCIRRPFPVPMYTSTFTFAPGNFNAEFHTLDQAIAEVARSTPGYLGEEAWENPETGLVSNVYYWESMEALQALMQHPEHLEAKRLQAHWLNGYRVVIAQLVATYGDDGIAHPLTGRQFPAR
jgi:heme-degrading monooxygenase HmoA